MPGAPSKFEMPRPAPCWRHPPKVPEAQDCAARFGVTLLTRKRPGRPNCGLDLACYYLTAPRARRVFLIAPRGARADLKALADGLGLPHLRLAWDLTTLGELGQIAAALNPFALVNAPACGLLVALDQALPAARLLALPTALHAPPVWLTPRGLARLLARLGHRPRVGAWTEPKGIVDPT